MEIRKTRPDDDFNAISRVYALSWQAAYRGIIPDTYLDELSDDRWTEVLKAGFWDSLVLAEDGKYVGTASICPARDEAKAGWGEIVSIYLLPEYFGKGCGAPVLGAAVTSLWQKGFKSIYLWVLEENRRARAFYEKNGFAPADDETIVNIGGKELKEIRYELK